MDRPTRRAFIKSGVGTAGTLALAAALPGSSRAQPQHRNGVGSLVDDTDLKALLLRAIDAARSMGASYADVRTTRTLYRTVSPLHVADGEEVHVGVRALVRGYWGFAAGPIVNGDELVRLGREAAFQARTNALGQTRTIDLAPVPVVSDGRWIMPVTIDPFHVHPLAIQDYLVGLTQQIVQEAELGPNEETGVDVDVEFFMQERVLATTDGTYITQRVYRTAGTVGVNVIRRGGAAAGRTVELVSPAGMGWELFHDQPVRERALQLILDARGDLDLPIRPVELGRFDTVLDASNVASLVSQSIGAASELDRALGYESNASGTSYLNDPSTMLDTFVVGSPLLHVTANRSEPGGVATVQWDDEGVSPSTFPVIEQGVLRNYQYTREGAGWLRAAGAARPFQSLGVAGAPTAVDAVLPQAANLVLASGTTDDDTVDARSLIANMKKGIAIRGGGVRMDFQKRGGVLIGEMYEIQNGKPVARLDGGCLIFNTLQLWKSLSALGGTRSARRFGLMTTKGEPQRQAYHSVTAVPASFKALAITDIARR